MPRLLMALFTALILVFSFSTPNCLADTTWQSVGPFGGNVRALVIDPTNSQTLYAGTEGGGVFKSTNGGPSWTPANSGLTNTSVYSLALDPTNSQTIYAGTEGGGVFKSTNGGASWTEANSGLTNKWIISLAIDPTNSQTLYAGTFGGVFKSTNGGASWTAASSGMTNTYVMSLAVDPKNCQTLYAGTRNNEIPTFSGGALYKSTDGGSSWSVAGSGLENTAVWSLAIDPTNSQTVYAGTWGGGVSKSTNGGASWTAASSGNIVKSLAIDPTNSQTVYAGTENNGLFKSTNGGASWTEAGSGMMNKAVWSLAIDTTNSQTIYAGTYGGGVFKSINGGASWTSTTSGVAVTLINSLAIDATNSQTIYAGTWGGGVSKSTNGGASWTSANSETTCAYVYSLAIDPINSQTIYAGTSGGLFKSINSGALWTAANSGLTNINNFYYLAIDPNNSQTIYVGTDYAGTDGDGGRVFKSTDGGASWTEADSGLPNARVWSLVIDPTNSQTIYAGTYNDGVFKSTNSGESWSAANSGLTNSRVWSLAIEPTNNQTLYAGTDGGGVFKSTNGGGLWTAANSGMTNTNVRSIAIDPTNSQTVYVGTGGGGVFKSTNGGASWTAANSGMTNTLIRPLAIDPTNSQTIYAGTYGGGIFKTSSINAPNITTSTTATFTAGIPGSYTLTATGSPKPTFSMSGNLPTGVTFDPTTGVLSGIPATGTAGAYNLMFTATNGVPPDATRGVTLTVIPGIPLSVAITTPANGSKTLTLTSITGTASGNGLAKVEVQITDGTYYLQANGTFATTPSWLIIAGSKTIWSLNTGTVPWVDGTTYTVSARASDGTNYTQPVKSTVKILAASSKGYTQLSLDFTPAQLKGGDTTIASGKIMRLPDDGSSLAGLSVNLIVTPPSTVANPTPAVIIIPMTTTSTGSFTSGVLTQFSTPGVYITQVRFDGNSTLAACSTVPEPLYINIQSGYAIVITGKATSNELLDQHTATTDTIVATLKKRGFLDANINYLKSTTTSAVTKQQIQNAITVWARDKMAAAPAPLYIVMIDHGMPDGFVLDSARLTPDDLKSFMDTLESAPAIVASGALTNFNRFIIIGSCYSGTFLSKLSKPGRVIITSAAPDEESLAGVNVFGINSGALYGGEYFVDTLFGFLGRGDTFKDAFNTATRAVSIRDPRISPPLELHYGSYDTLAQHPLLDDNGDAQASYLLSNTDGIVTAALTLGEGIRVNALSSPADIAAVAPADSLSTTTSMKQLWLTANMNSRVARAWAEIRRPNTQTTGGGSGQVIPTFDMIPLIYDGTNWIGNYTKFDTAGTYDIYYYTKDNQTNEISPTVTSKVYKQQTGNMAPKAFSLISPLNEAAPAPLFPLTWQESTDPDGLTYTLLVATNQSFTNIIYREENIPQAATYMPKDALKNPASATGGYYCQNGDSFCYWKVQAIDGYGATTESNIRSFTIVTTNALPGIIKGFVRDATTGAPLAGTTVTAGSSQFTTLSNGGFIMMLSSGTYTVTATANGYQTKTLVNIALSSGAVYDAGMSLESNTPPPVPGDLNGDGKVDLADAIIALQVMSNITPAQTYFKEGDVSGDGKIGLPKAIYILQKLAGVR